MDPVPLKTGNDGVIVYAPAWLGATVEGEYEAPLLAVPANVYVNEVIESMLTNPLKVAVRAGTTVEAESEPFTVNSALRLFAITVRVSALPTTTVNVESPSILVR